MECCALRLYHYLERFKIFRMTAGMLEELRNRAWEFLFGEHGLYNEDPIHALEVEWKLEHIFGITFGSIHAL